MLDWQLGLLTDGTIALAQVSGQADVCKNAREAGAILIRHALEPKNHHANP